MILIPIIAFGVGILMGIVLSPGTPSALTPYYGMAVLAGLDSVFGGCRSALEGKFKTDVFVTGFVSNIVVAIAMFLLGDKIGLPLYLVAAIVLGSRLYNNLSLMRRIALTRWSDSRQRRKMEAEISPQTTSIL